MQTNDLTAELVGNIRTIGFSGKLAIVHDGGASHPNAPSHRVFLINEDSVRLEVGAAWSQKIKQGVRAGEEFLSANIDDPSFERPLSFALFQSDEHTWEATWRRRQTTN
ncbi:MAG: DUF736 domain-containing protein [Alphaproteobacteria bacterium]|nr:DUF736 domain-containing protein [Alphaproteobacteria bacterium]